MKATFSTKIEMEDPVDKMRLIRNKMVEARRAAENEKAREANAKMKVMKATWGYEELIHANNVDRDCVQDPLQLVAVGADVEALYPNLFDL